MTVDWLSFSLLFVLGIGMAFVYLFLLWVCVQKFCQQKGGQWIPMGGFFLRLLLIGLCLYTAAQCAQILGIAAFMLGFLPVKNLAVRKWKIGGEKA